MRNFLYWTIIISCAGVGVALGVAIGWGLHDLARAQGVFITWKAWWSLRAGVPFFAGLIGLYVGAHWADQVAAARSKP